MSGRMQFLAEMSVNAIVCSLSDPSSIIFLKSSSKQALYLVRWSAREMMRAREGLVWMQDLLIVDQCLNQPKRAVP